MTIGCTRSDHSSQWAGTVTGSSDAMNTIDTQQREGINQTYGRFATYDGG
jgi:hypothetical protein